MQRINFEFREEKSPFCCILQCIHMHGHLGTKKPANIFRVNAKCHYLSTANLRKNQAMRKGCFRLTQSENLTIRQS